MTWTRRILALVATGLFLAGGVLLAHWLREREALSDLRFQAGSAGADRPEGPRPGDPRMRTFLPEEVVYGPVRRIAFGKDSALFAAGSSTRGPDEVFGAIVERSRRRLDRDMLDRLAKEGPSAAVALRLNYCTGSIPGGAFCLRLAPDVEAARDGRLVLEPGGVILAWGEADRWHYVTFYFPQGLDLDAFLESHGAPRDALAPLGPEAAAALEPTLRLGSDGPATVLCRAQGRARDAIDRTAAALERAGWETVHREEGETEARVLRGPGGEVWLSTSDAERVGGLVTVMIGG